MTRYNNKKSILERGGLMIEALAMLGLIAVVTPTMYKKSAERTLEVEDINTATAMRTYIDAVESYVSTNYSTIVEEMENSSDSVKTIESNKLTEFLPYQFQPDKLYDFTTPEAKVVKQDGSNNLTAFVVFGAKAGEADGIGRERTVRIASLIGANGGYVSGNNTARGVGGIWKLENDDFTKIVGSKQVNSIVATTGNAINAVNSEAAAAADNTKYLQRTREDEPEGEKNELWRNAMRTDLYLGGYAENDENDNNSDLHNIRNVNRLIIGSEYAGVSAANENNNNYGLYVSGDGDNSDTFIAGSLEAGANQFFVDEEALKFGRDMVSGGTLDRLTIEADTGKITQYGNIDLAKDFFDNEGNTVLIGNDSISGFYYILKAKSENNTKASIYLGSDSTFRVYAGNNNLGEITESGDGKIKNGGDLNDTISGVQVALAQGSKNKINHNGYAKAPDGIKYQYRQEFPVYIGGNTRVRGVLAANQIDTQKMRMATLSAGSEHVDDDYHWLNVSDNGIYIRDRNNRLTDNVDDDRKGTKVAVNETTISMRAGNGSSEGYSDGLFLNSITSDSSDSISGRATRFILSQPNKTSLDSGIMAGQAYNIHFLADDKLILDSLSNNREGVRLEMDKDDKTITMSNPYNDYYRVLMKDYGTMGLIGSNLNVVKVNDSGYKRVFSVRGNSYDGNIISGVKSDRDVVGSEITNEYDIAMHGNVVFTKEDVNANSSLASDFRYMSVGTEQDAGVIITETDDDTYSYNEKVLFVDLTDRRSNLDLYSDGIFKHNDAIPYSGYSDSSSDAAGWTIYSDLENSNLNNIDPGTVYIRKGMINVLPSKKEINSNTNTTVASNSGGVHAPRLVANNVNSKDTTAYKIPNLFSSAGNAYFDTGTVRYDTYMVNPAYTSVMHDIKLTTRGGARLSDILPDFITKGIYIANNDKDDTLYTFKFQFAGTDLNSVKVNGVSVSNSTYNWASPYIGTVPAPQCPPGYGRVITVNPAGSRMAQAGMLDKSITRDNANDISYVVAENPIYNRDNRVDILSGFKSGTVSNPDYKELKIEADTLSAAFSNVSISDSMSNAQIKGIKEITPLTYTDEDDNTKAAYVLTAKDNSTLPPMVFQQSTWLKSLAIPVIKDKSTQYPNDSNSKGYTRGWAIMLGFLYDHTYEDYFPDEKHRLRKLTEAETGAGYDRIYWNVFPVTKGSLEAFITTYCYFDRNNIYNLYDKSNVKKYVDQYNIMDHLPYDYKKVIENSEYKNRLNDPALKYNEVW